MSLHTTLTAFVQRLREDMTRLVERDPSNNSPDKALST